MDNTTEAAATEIPPFISNIDKIWGSLGLLCGAFTVLGNIFVFAILIKLSKRSLSDCAFVNLSIIDSISGVMAIAGSWFLLDDRTWIASGGVWYTITCYTAGMTWNAASLTTPLLVSVVSIGRLAAVYLPLRYDTIFTPPVVHTMLVYCWVHGVVASTLSVWGDTGAGRYELYRSWGFCDQSIKDAYSKTETFTALYLSFFTIPMILTCGCIVFCNLCVMVRIIKMKMKPDRNLRKMSETASTTHEVVLAKMEKIGRRLSNVRSYNYKSSNVSNTATIAESLKEDSTTYRENESGSHYKHFEIVSLDENSEVTVNSQQRAGLKRRQSRVQKVKNFQRAKRARRENRAILMTFLVSISYLICYTEIINFYTLASFVTTPQTLFDKILGVHWNKTVKTYVNLWYYYSLFVAAATNVLLHFLFNHVVRKGFSSRSRDQGRFQSSITKTTHKH